jgi:hypothetical protein
MTQPRKFHGDRNRAWNGLKTFAEVHGAKFLVGISVTCITSEDDAEFDAALEFIRFVGKDHIMGLAVGNEIDLQIGGEHWNHNCKYNLWNRGEYLNTFYRRVASFDEIEGMSELPVTAVISSNGIFTDKVKDFVGKLYERYGTRYVFSANIYPQFSYGLKKAGCNKAVEVGTKFAYDEPRGFVPAVVADTKKMFVDKGWTGMKLWVGETGWNTQGWCVLGCNHACHDIKSQKQFYQDFLRWDLSAGEEVQADHAFFFTMRDSSVFGSQEKFGLISNCQEDRCKFQF